MLVLSRKVNESIIIGGNIKVTFISYEKGRARLAVEAPQEISIHREEVERAIKAGDRPKYSSSRRRCVE